MKILIISFRYTPFQSIGTNRIVSLTEYFEKNNIEFKVFTSYVGSHNNSFFVKDERVHYFPWFDIKKLKTVSANKYNTYTNSGEKRVTNSLNINIFKKLFMFGRTFLESFLIPDPYIFWARSVINSGNKIVDNFSPDLIISSSYPYSSHIAAKYFAKKHSIKWFAELRDPWVNNHGNLDSYFRKITNKTISKRIFKNVDTFITVSRIWQQEIEQLYGKNCLLIRNGFISFDDTKTKVNSKILNTLRGTNRKKILYAGSIFSKNQDIDSFLKFFFSNSDVLFNYDFVYIGKDSDIVNEIVVNNNYSRENLLIFDKVDYPTSLWLQKNSDLLLLLNWSNGSKGIIPGKFYEYIGANKPILLWNLEIVNELSMLCRDYNDENNGSKIIIIEELETAYNKIKDFNFDSSMINAHKFSRKCQFDNLLKYINESVK